VTLGPLALAATGNLPIAGALNASLGALTLAGDADALIAGTANITLGALTLQGAATNAQPISGTLNATLGALTLSGYAINGEVAPPVIGGGGGYVFRPSDDDRKRFEAYLDSLEPITAQAKIKLGALTASGRAELIDPPAKIVEAHQAPLVASLRVQLGTLTVQAAANIDWADLIAEEDEELLAWA
jgi:hypothetical protein